MKRKLIPLIQLLFGLGLITYILSRMHASGELGKVAEFLRSAGGNWHLLLLSFLLFGMCMFCCVKRWQLLLRALGYDLTTIKLCRLYLIGHFFNAFMLGSLGGDLVKAYYVAAETNGKKTEIVSSVFIDRLVGLLALVLLSVTVVLVRFQFFLRHQETRVAMVFILTAFVGSIVGLFVVLKREMFEKFAIFRRLEESSSIGGTIGRVYKSLHFCLNHPSLLVKTMTIAVGNHLAIISATCFLGMAMGMPMSYWDYLTVFPVINAIAAIPLSPGAIGTRESACIFLLGVFSIPASSALTISLLLYSIVMLWSMIGGVVYLSSPGRASAAQLKQEDSEGD